MLVFVAEGLITFRSMLQLYKTLSLIDRSRIVMCDCTGRNPNVFYEAGIAHSLGREVIIIGSPSITGAVRESVRMFLPQNVLTKGTLNAPNQIGIYHWITRF